MLPGHRCCNILGEGDPLRPAESGGPGIGSLPPIGPHMYKHATDRDDTIQVYNVIPSISAITGVTPQTYMWRIAVAFHVGPRMVIAKVYYNYFISEMPKSNNPTGYLFVNLCYWLNIIEISAICGVTYISNRENYRTYYYIHLRIYYCLVDTTLS